MKLRMILFIFAVAACGNKDASSSKETATAGGGEKPAKPAGLTKACELMARADAEAAVGMKLPQTMEDVPKHEWEVASCSYMSPDYFDVELIVRDWEGLKNGMKVDADHKPLIAMTGLGDEAWGENNGIVFTRLYVRKGKDRGIVITLNSPEIRTLDDKGMARAKVLALTILPKL
jgi:hypothetical protein